MRNLYLVICFFVISGTLGYFSQYLDVESSGELKKELYAVQLASLKYPVYLSYFKGVDSMVEMKGKDGMYCYCVKPFTDKESARKRCNDLKNLGYPDGKVVNVSKKFASKELSSATVIESSSGSNEVRSHSADQPLTKIRENQNPSQQQESPVVKMLSSMKDVGTSYFYSIQLISTSSPQYPQSFKGVENVKEFKDSQGVYRYLHGNFADVEDAQRYLREQIATRYTQARVVVVDKGQVVTAPKVVDASRVVAKKQQPTVYRKKGYVKPTKGRQYKDYYYEDPESLLSALAAPLSYSIMVGPFNDKAQAQIQLQKLHEMGFSSAQLKARVPASANANSSTVKSVNKSGKSSVKKSITNGDQYTIQLLATIKIKNPTSFKLKGVRRVQSPQDHLYRYYFGQFDNYWVCRRKLRDIRIQGYSDAFIVKLK